MTTTLIVDLIKRVPTAWPRIESDEAIMSVGCARPLEDAFRISQHDLITWTGQLTGLDLLDAYQLVAQAGRAPAGNVCDPNHTMVAKIDKAFLPGVPSVYDGVHQRLRRIAATHTGWRA